MIAAPTRQAVAIAVAAVAFCIVPPQARALDPRFDLDPDVLDKSAEPSAGYKRGRPVRKIRSSAAGMSDYTVRPGDHIFKILMKEYDLSNAEAEALIPEVKRLNGISDIRRLQVGRSLRIPLAHRREQFPVAEKVQPKRLHTASGRADGRPVPAVSVAGGDERPVGHSMRMMSLAYNQEPANLDAVRQAWSGLVSSQPVDSRPISIEDANFSLSLDPESFPSFPAADGGRVLVDAEGKIPPLVRALIEGKDPSVRIVSESPRNRKRFMASLLESARFYSVEDNVSLSFGADPKLTVNADFKIEKTPESVLSHDVVLMNVEEYRRGMPSSLVQFLRREGFQVVEPFPGREGASPRGGQTLYQITAHETRGMVDGLLRALNVRYEADRSVELYGMADGGLKLDVRADRYFEDGRDRYVVSYFDGDPVSYTLTRLLETRGYRVVVLDPKDDFRKVSEKILSRLRLPGVFAQHDLFQYRDAPYGIRMSGVRLRSQGAGGETVFLTNVELDPLFRDILDYNGYSVISY
ncbi:LysM peptidoglycan-binding domain-containing protein [Geobacter benzoatilyticus]|uniref:LysM peptidoglycan-binding domain-containing protein n=1 Tax=Geobacter benzoatilyticus TaxID=2815309 RepID=A0ABX7Q4D6_9BACT|nr:LysM peptidoglycan-binding domain-containing protein [Geobacter benzoatilyticus]QSV45840.1 LysM peptidoglycan-binding domain-containing protein [Geobacter benzoatilyticus]